MTPHRLHRILSLTVALALATGITLASVTPAHAAGPSNDNFADAVTLNPAVTASTDVYGTTVGATTEAGEPSHDPDGVTTTSSSIWYSFTSAFDGNLTMTVSGASDFDPVLAVYTGYSVGALTRIAANDDRSPISTAASITSMPIHAGWYYRIVVAGKDGGQSFTKLTYIVNQHPRNDSVTNPEELTANWSQARWNENATAEPGEVPAIAGQAASKSVWWRYQPAHNGTLSLSTNGSGFDTVLAVFRQESSPFSFGSLTRLASNDDANPSTSTSAISGLELKANKTYWICVDGYQGVTGEITLTNTWVPSARPNNDDFADAAPLADGASLTGSTATATIEPGEPQHLPNGDSGKSVWYRLAPSIDGTVSVNLAGTDFDSVAALYRGTSLSELTPIAEDRGASASPVRSTQLSKVPVLAGVQYYLAIAGANGASGNLAGTFHFVGRPAVVSVSPGGGPLAGGNWVEITGTKLAGASTTVAFGGVAAEVTANEETSETQVRAKVPGGLPAGPIAITVSTDGGVAGTTLSYVVGAPTLTTLSARYVRTSGGQRIQVTGADFVGNPTVSVGGKPAAGVKVASSTSLSFVTPKHAQGDAEVTVTTVTGTTETSSAGWLTYLDQPKVSKLSRTKGSRHGGYHLTISGKGLGVVTKVLVGSRKASFALVNGRIDIVVPKNSRKATVYLRVVTPVGTSPKSKAAKFRYR